LDRVLRLAGVVYDGERQSIKSIRLWKHYPYEGVLTGTVSF
jgi:hypothetical protein